MTALWRSRSSTRRTPPSSPTMGSRSPTSKPTTRTLRSRRRGISRGQGSSCGPRRTTMSTTALVTGASRGIGLETARRFILNHDDITTVVMFARDSEDFDEAVRQLESELPIGRRIVPIKVDVGARPALQKAVEQAYGQVGNIDIVVNNAGYTNPVPLQQVKMSDFEKTIEVNLYGPFTIVKTLLNRGNTFDLIVNIASTAGINGRSGWLTYSASKAAVINMSQVMREELSIYGKIGRASCRERV